MQGTYNYPKFYTHILLLSRLPYEHFLRSFQSTPISLSHDWKLRELQRRKQIWITARKQNPQDMPPCVLVDRQESLLPQTAGKIGARWSRVASRQTAFWTNHSRCRSRLRSETCALLGCYSVTSGNFLPTARDNRSVPSSGFKGLFGFLKLEGGYLTL